MLVMSIFFSDGGDARNYRPEGFRGSPRIFFVRVPFFFAFFLVELGIWVGIFPNQTCHKADASATPLVTLTLFQL